MGYFDFLVTKGNPPIKDKEYIYLLDCVWKINELSDPIPIKEHSIVIDVEQHSGGYNFTIKETGERYTCTYAWAFADNTPVNKAKISMAEKAKEKSEKAQQEYKFLLNQIDTLEIKE